MKILMTDLRPRLSVIAVKALTVDAVPSPPTNCQNAGEKVTIDLRRFSSLTAATGLGHSFLLSASGSTAARGR